MKILKGSLVAAFLALGMWASQASAHHCNCATYEDPPPVNHPLCNTDIVCAGGQCTCGENWEQECCGPAE
uniref:Secreted protein n=1 Tax=Candidatus Kentrum sp. UNK TaxID=2126344 RepID=A0A451B4R6_9GAMM|nr:MAG: hypothetical protein BECKUNK1418G_GA0071005_11907 [Candidatus Kentron sp. UNK]VFK73288.1 MAG: hypothetical protein BECKUNK1418H_GA0071006_11837 [Candidatus Kentron sp. UNK]